MRRKIRMGMVGGGRVYRGRTAWPPGSTAKSTWYGAFSSDRINRDRRRVASAYSRYKNYEEMMEFESELPAEERIDCVSIVTPNLTHYDIAMKAQRTASI